MRRAIRLTIAAIIATTPGGCIAYTVASTAVSVTATVVETAVDVVATGVEVTADVVAAGADAVTGGDDDEAEDE